MFINKPRVSRPYKIKQDMKSMHELNTYKYVIWLYYGDILTKNGNRNYEVISAEQTEETRFYFSNDSTDSCKLKTSHYFIDNFPASLQSSSSYVVLKPLYLREI